MAPRLDQQLEKLIDKALKHRDFQALEEFLQDETNEGANQKCSKQFLNKLDKLVNTELDNGNAKQASLGLCCLHKFGNSMASPRTQGMSEMKARDLWMKTGLFGSEALLSLAEDFLDALLAVHESSNEGKYQVTESFLHPIGQLAADSKMHILIQKEAVRKLNVILDGIPKELKKGKEILSSVEVSLLMKNLAGQILESGDYDLQIALLEALCRMTTHTQRQQLAPHWFTMEFVASAFNKIKDSEFETDCRKFLNLLNGMQGDSRRVYSYPCLEVFLGQHELLMPLDEKLEEFWIDFNLGSQSISFYFSVADEEAQNGQWDTMCIFENEVHSYQVKEEHSRKVLKVVLSDPLCVGGIEGSDVTVHFSASLDIMQAAVRVFGNTKNKTFVGKSSSSVVKTTVQIILDEGNSQSLKHKQALVPESQVSSTPSMDQGPSGMRRSSPDRVPPHRSSREDRAERLLPLLPPQHSVQMTTPAKMKVSESSTFVSSSAERRVGSSSFINALSASTPMSRAKIKPPLNIVSSSERKKGYNIKDLMMTKISCSISSVETLCQSRMEQALQKSADWSDARVGAAAERFRKNIPVNRVLEMVQDGQKCDEEVLGDNTNAVPDSQPAVISRRPLLPLQAAVEPRKKKHSEAQLKGQKGISRGLMTLYPLPALPQTAFSHDTFILPVKAVNLQNRLSSAHGSTAENSQQDLHAQITQRLEELLQEQEAQAVRVEKRRPEALGKAQAVGEEKVTPGALGKAQAVRVEKRRPEALGKAQAVGVEKRRPETLGKAQAVGVEKSRPEALGKAQAVGVEKRRPEALGKAQAVGVEKRRPEALGKAQAVRVEKRRPEALGKAQAVGVEKRRLEALGKAQAVGVEKRRPEALGKARVGEKTLTPQTSVKQTPAKPHLKEPLLPEQSPCNGVKVTGEKTSRQKRSGAGQVAGRVTAFISSQYRAMAETSPAPGLEPDCRFKLDQSWSLASMGKGVEQASGFLKSSSHSKRGAEQPKVDVYCFGEDSPKRHEKKGQKCLEWSALKSSTFKDPGILSSAVKEGPPAKRPGHHVKMHLFSDTDTDITTDVSWLRESSRKPKPKVMDYSRQRCTKNAPAPETTFESSDMQLPSPIPVKPEPLPSQKPVKGQAKPKEKRKAKPRTQKGKKAPVAPVGLSGRPQRASTISKSYRERSESDSDSPSEHDVLPRPQPQVSHPAVKPKVKSANGKAERGRKTSEQPELMKQQPVAADALKESWVSRFSAFSPPPPPVEMLRSMEKAVPLSRSPITPLRSLPVSPADAPSPLLDSPKPWQGIRPSSFYRPHKSPSLSPIQNDRGHPVPSPLQTLLTSTAQEESARESPPSFLLPEDCLDESGNSQSLCESFHKNSPNPAVTRSHCSKDSFSNLAALSARLEKTPTSSCSRAEPVPLKLHQSGPSSRLKRRASPLRSHASEEEEEKEKGGVQRERAIRLKPRKLFKASRSDWDQEKASTSTTLGLACPREEEEENSSDDEDKENKFRAEWASEAMAKSQSIIQLGCTTDTAGDVEVQSHLSSHVVSSYWEVDPAPQDLSSVCRQFSSELHRKFQNRTRRMDLYAKQSLNTVQKHVSSISVQVHQYRTQRLEKVKGALQEEIRNLEQDEFSLRSMEKELIVYWGKQSQAFHSFQKNKIQRLQHLRSEIDTNVCHGLEYEERIFTSEMCLMRKDMKSVQDKLFRDMQEEELLSVRRGLQTLFLPSRDKF